MDTSISDLWWLKPEPVRGRFNAPLALGAQMAANKNTLALREREGIADRDQRERQFAQTMKLRLINEATERAKVDLAAQQYESKALTQTMQGRGLAELNSFLSRVTAEDLLTDPETEADFFELTSRWAPFIPQSTFNSIYNSTFKPAKDRKAMAERVKASGQNRTTAPILNDERAASLEAKADELDIIYPEGAAELRQRAAGIRNAGQLNPAQSGPPEVGETDLPDGSKMMYYRDSKGGLKIIKPPKDNMSDLERVEYTTELRALQAKYADSDLKAEEFDKQREELHRRFQNKKSSKSGAPSLCTMAVGFYFGKQTK